MPPNTVKVDRTTVWGNPFVVGKRQNAGRCVELYTLLLGGYVALTAGAIDKIEAAQRHAKNIHELHNKNLACWCRLCEKHRNGKPLGVTCNECAPCHADVLLEVANRKGETT